MISVILLTYNSIRVLPDCLGSLEGCTMAGNLELIFVDNGSTDGTVEWISEYSNQADLPFLGVKILVQEANHGFAYGNNRGMEIASGDYILLLNPDTIVGKDSIEVCVDRIKTEDGVGAVGCRLELPDGRLDRACRRGFPTLWNSFTRLSGLSLLFRKIPWMNGYNLSHLDEWGSYPVDCLSGAFMVVSADVFLNVGGLDEDYFMYGEDIDWCKRINAAGYKIWYEGRVTTIHLKGGNGGKRSPESLWHFYDSMVLYYAKHYGKSCNNKVVLLLKVLVWFMYSIHLTFSSLLSVGRRVGSQT
ncbi:glycosyltransferase family 2 protein [Alicyclobacillus acidiphilus]|uniref:glycosyltransferase family 2 protein n=1 Tax=Alicyclobacillus acidiphilus TaxID=182455 RepID=UPI0014703A5C|nr:glycosyltransferase family 2 protein [Alicyclobacillus acidiphilus]